MAALWLVSICMMPGMPELISCPCCVKRQACVTSDLILLIERRFLSEELEHLAAMPKKVLSLRLALSQLDATINLLHAIRETTSYQYADLFFTLAKNRVHGMPRDEAQQFFCSHAKRLDNLGIGRWEGAEAGLINGRISNIKVAQRLYTKLQRKALVPHEVREEQALYLVPDPPSCVEGRTKSETIDHVHNWTGGGQHAV